MLLGILQASEPFVKDIKSTADILARIFFGATALGKSKRRSASKALRRSLTLGRGADSGGTRSDTEGGRMRLHSRLDISSQERKKDSYEFKTLH